MAINAAMKELGYKRYMLGVLLMLLAFNFVDRLALGLVLQNIKIDLHLSDTQLGLLSGIAFALFYSLLGVPIARLADRGDRVTIIWATAAVWSIAVALCGLAASFTQLLLIRVIVGIGEAGCVPPAHSLIADHFTRVQRPRAVSTYMLGASLSPFVGYFVAGWLNQLYGWRVMFIVLGLPGLGLAALARFTLREPRRAQLTDRGNRPLVSLSTGGLAPETPSAQPSLREVYVTLWRNRTFRHLLFCFSVLYFFGYGVVQWQPAFLIRSFGVKGAELGTYFALIYGLGGLLGTYLGGELATRYAAGNESLQLKGMAAAYSVVGIISAFIYVSPNRFIAVGLMGLVSISIAAVNGPFFATTQTLIPQRMRAVSIAVIYLFANLIGFGLGPLATGAISDALRPHFGDESLRYALLALSPGYLWSGWHLRRASKTVTRDLNAAVEFGVAP